MVEVIRSYINDGISLVQLGAVLVAGAMVVATWVRTRAVVATVAMMLVGALAVGYVHNAGWFGARVAEDLRQRDNGAPALEHVELLTGGVPVRVDGAGVLAADAVKVAVTLAVPWLVARWLSRLRPGSVWRALRRVAVRASWQSVARSSGLAVSRDRRTFGTVSSALSDVLWAKPSKGGPRREPVERLPRIRRGRAGTDPGTIVYQLCPARGQTVDDVAGKAGELAAGLGVGRVLVERDRPNRGRLVVQLADPLARSLDWPGPGSGVGVTSSGEPLHLPMLGGHYLVAGTTGSGKSAFVNALLADLVTSGVPRKVIGVDPKLVELSAWGPALDRVIVDLAEVSDVLAAVHGEVKDRYRRLAEEGCRKLDTPTEAMPLLVLVVDELGEVARQAPGEERAAPPGAAAHVVLARGHRPGRRCRARLRDAAALGAAHRRRPEVESHSPGVRSCLGRVRR